MRHPLRFAAREAFGALENRRLRTFLTSLGLVLGSLTVVVTLGVSQTAAAQVVESLDRFEATLVRVTPVVGADAGAAPVLPWDSGGRLESLNGAVAASTRSEIELDGALTRTVRLPRSAPGAGGVELELIAADASIFDVVDAEVHVGRIFDDGHVDRADAVVVLGIGAAERLNLHGLAAQPSLLIGEEQVTVLGVVGETKRDEALLNAMVIPVSLARERFGLDSPDEVLIEVQLGAASLIAEQAPTALSPNDPALVRAATPPTLSGVRGEVSSDLEALFLAVGLASVVLGAIGVANVMLVSVMERRHEIGLRRALGSSRGLIAGQILIECFFLGSLAGLLGGSLGVSAVVVIAAGQEWTPVLNLTVPVISPIGGALVALLAGVHPALRAASVQPADSLRA